MKSTRKKKLTKETIPFIATLLTLLISLSIFISLVVVLGVAFKIMAMSYRASLRPMPMNNTMEAMPSVTPEVSEAVTGPALHYSSVAHTVWLTEEGELSLDVYSPTTTESLESIYTCTVSAKNIASNSVPSIAKMFTLAASAEFTQAESEYLPVKNGLAERTHHNPIMVKNIDSSGKTVKEVTVSDNPEKFVPNSVTKLAQGLHDWAFIAAAEDFEKECGAIPEVALAVN